MNLARVTRGDEQARGDERVYTRGDERVYARGDERVYARGDECVYAREMNEFMHAEMNILGMASCVVKTLINVQLCQ